MVLLLALPMKNRKLQVVFYTISLAKFAQITPQENIMEYLLVMDVLAFSRYVINSIINSVKTYVENSTIFVLW